MTGTDGEQKLYIGTETGLYECDTAPTNWTIEHVDKMSGSADNCRDMIVHQGAYGTRLEQTLILLQV